MARSRIATLATAAAAAALLTLTACGGGGASSENSAIIDELMTEIGDQEMPTEIQDCIREGLSGYSTEELTALRDGETDADVPMELQDKVITMMTGCVGDLD
jgi:hypothetical protein